MVIDLSGRVAIVTGAGAGIGREIALTLAREGVRTVAFDLSQPALDELGRVFAAEGFDGLQVRCDVSDSASVAAAVEQVVGTFGRIDIVVNNAGVFSAGSVETLPEEKWDLNFAVNTKGTFLVSQAVIPVMKKQKSGRIINAASFAAIIPSCNTAAYAASKGAVVSLTRVMAGELGPFGITVNCYAPGMVPTGMNNFDKLDDAEQNRLLDLLSIRRWQTAEDVAHLICFLASDQASYITGTLVDVSGGKLATQIPAKAYEGLS
ncbi:MAG: SDR family oxidoreductase [Spirochaetaceae bacterium]|nr:MAG: SDR family oxidoreductase [Spirochaetaceae bacterium]